MLEFHSWPTPNAHKVSIMLEETGIPYEVVPVNIGNGGQFTDEFLKIAPNNKMPAIVDHDAPGGPVSIFESGAILMYLAEKSGRFWPDEPQARYEVAQWVMWQMAGLGPMLGQAYHFRHFAPEPQPYADKRFTAEITRLIGVLDKRLHDRQFIAGDYSIADMASYSWTTMVDQLDIAIADYPGVEAWQRRMAARPGVQRGMALQEDVRLEVEKAIAAMMRAKD